MSNKENNIEKHMDLAEDLTNADLSELLGFFKQKKSGNKSVLLDRVKELLKKNDDKVLTKIRQLHKKRQSNKKRWVFVGNPSSNFNFLNPQSSYENPTVLFSRLREVNNCQHAHTFNTTAFSHKLSLSLQQSYSVQTYINFRPLVTRELNFTKIQDINKGVLDYLFGCNYEIHLKIGYSADNTSIPPSTQVKLNGQKCNFSWNENRSSINLTPFFKTQNSICGGMASIAVDFNESDIKHNYYCSINLFKRLTPTPNPNVLRSININTPASNVATSKKNAKIEFVRSKNVLKKEDTIKLIKGKIEEKFSDFKIDTDYVAISLKCPLSQNRMEIPSRGRNCSHIQCFDLTNYVQLCEKSSKWSCPICDKDVDYKYLVVDSLITEILTKIKVCDDIKVYTNGKYEVYTHQSEDDESTDHETVDEDDDENNDDEVKFVKQKGNPVVHLD